MDLVQLAWLFLLTQRPCWTPAGLFHFMNRKREIHHQASKQTRKSCENYLLTVKSSGFQKGKNEGRFLDTPLPIYPHSSCHSVYAMNQTLHILPSYLTLENHRTTELYQRTRDDLSSVEISGVIFSYTVFRHKQGLCSPHLRSKPQTSLWGLQRLDKKRLQSAARPFGFYSCQISSVPRQNGIGKPFKVRAQEGTKARSKSHFANTGKPAAPCCVNPKVYLFF